MSDDRRGTHLYEVCGWRLRSNVPIPYLLPASDGSLHREIAVTALQRLPEAHVALMERSEPAFNGGGRDERTGHAQLRVWNLDGGERLFALGDGTICVVDAVGTGIAIHWPDQHNDPWEFVLSFMLAHVLQRQGCLCLHAAAVKLLKGAALVAGRPGVGKSTVAAALSLRGHRLLTDDLAVIEPRGGSMVVQPGPRVVRPRRSGFAALGAGAAERLLEAPENLDWCLLDPDGSSRPAALSSTAIDTIYLLVPDAVGRGVTMQPVPRSQVAAELMADSWGVALADRRTLQQGLDSVGRLLENIDAERIAYNPHDPDWVAQLAERILA